MASNPLFIITDFCLHFPNDLSYGYLKFEGNEKILCEGRKKVLPTWLSQFSSAKLRQPTGQTFFLLSQRNFPISFKPKVAIAVFIWKMRMKT